MSREYQENLSHLNDLLELSEADGYASPIEIAFIDIIAERLGVSKCDLEKLKNKELRIPFSPPKYEHQIIPQFHRVILLMGIDRVINKEELDFCSELGLKLGLNLCAVNEALEKAKNCSNNIIPVNELEKIFKKYYN